MLIPTSSFIIYFKCSVLQTARPIVMNLAYPGLTHNQLYVTGHAALRN